MRRARADEVESLSDLAHASKAHWGYSRQFMQACRTELTIGSDYLLEHLVWVLELEAGPVGFYSLEKLFESRVELGHLFVTPEQISQGFGRVLMDHAIAEAKRLGCETLVIQADPNAERFYAGCGASTVGAEVSASIPGRLLPLMEIERSRSNSEPSMTNPRVDPTDHLEILDLISEYARCFDSEDLVAFSNLFTEDGSLSTPIGGGTTPAGVCEWAEQRWESLRKEGVEPRHIQTNTQLTPIGPGGVQGTTQLLLIWLNATDGTAQLKGASRYDDEFRNTAAGWRFHRRSIGSSEPFPNTAPPKETP